MVSRKKALRIVYVLAALVCISALAIAGATYRKWHFKGKEDGVYIFTAETEETEKDGKKVCVARSVMIVRSTKDKDGVSVPDADFTINVEQTEKDLEEIDLLRQQDKRELLRVIETEVDSEVGRTYSYKYVLADGRESTMGENDPDEEISEKVMQVDVKEIWELQHAGKGELLDPAEKEVKGKTFIFERRKLTLDDGREVILSIGTPKEE